MNGYIILGTRCFKPLDCNFNQKEHIDARSFGYALFMQTENKILNIKHNNILRFHLGTSGLQLLAMSPGNSFLKIPWLQSQI